jgi:multidrug transporter EmrE-like cation transporter
VKLVEFCIILSGVLLNAIAQTLIKAGANKLGHFAFTLDNIPTIGLKVATNLPILGGLTCYVFSVVLWIMALSRVEVSIAYPMLSIGYLVTAVIGWAIFNEAVTPMRLAGIAVIIVGVAIVARS